MPSKKKGKKRKNLAPAKGFGAKNFTSELHKAEALLAREQWEDAIALLTPLSETHPKDIRIWEYLMEAYFQIQQVIGYQSACEHIAELAPNRSEIFYALGGAYLLNEYPFLALDAFQRALQLNPTSDKASEARNLLDVLETNTAEIQQELGLTDAERPLLLDHERAQGYMAQNQYDQARAAAEAVLAAKPDFWAAHNNLGLIAWMNADLDGAIAHSQTVLENDPNNVHALSNLVRYHVVQGQPDEARTVGDRLKTCESSAWDRLTKKVEGLSFLGDDAGVIEVFEAATASGDLNDPPHTSLFHHLVAVALCRCDRQSEAKKQWRLALKARSGYDLAQENLDNLLLPADQQMGAWPFETHHWLPEQSMRLLYDLMMAQEGQDSATVTNAFFPFLKQYPFLLSLVPLLLERGSPASREMAINLALVDDSEQSRQQLKDFALGQHGPDDLRYETAIALLERDVLSSEEPTRLWLNGEWREVQLLAQEFHDEPLYEHSKQVGDWLHEGASLLRELEPEAAAEAEVLFKRAIAAEPDMPDLQYNLSLAYDLQEREEEARELREAIAEQFPDYLFAQVSLAEVERITGNPEAAEAILKPLLTRERFHLSEFAALSEAYLQVLTALGKKDIARGWLERWLQVMPEHERLGYWRSQLQ